jgi:hypothetical protein
MATLVVPMNPIMRLLLAVAVSAAALYFNVPVSRGSPWCAVTNNGTGNMYWGLPVQLARSERSERAVWQSRLLQREPGLRIVCGKADDTP